jgi:hypothetical protein
MIETIQFEGVKVAMNQTRSGFILTLSIHPDDLPMQLTKDFVGARYQVVMVRLNNENKPMNRDHEYQRDIVRTAGMLCRDKLFQKFLLEKGQTFDEGEQIATEWLKEELGIQSRAELKDNRDAARHFTTIQQEFLAWKQSV